MKRLSVAFSLILIAACSEAQTRNIITHRPNGQADTTVVDDPEYYNTDTTARFVERMPEFKGDLKSYIHDHLWVYDDCVVDSAIVVVQFIVSKSGSLKNIQIVKSSGCKSFEDSVVKMVSEMPPWKPGKQHDAPVDVTYTLRVPIDLE